MRFAESVSSPAAPRARLPRLRPVAALLHRWMGLATAAFLFVAGITGAIIAWSQELDAWLNPQLLRAHVAGPAQSAPEVARAIEARHPEAQVTFVPLSVEPGRSWSFGVEPRIDPLTSQPHELGFSEVFVEPATGAELGTRQWGGAWPITRETLVSFLYELHYSLHLPAIAGNDRWGVWLMGAVALIWAVDCFIGMYLTLPARPRAARAVGADVRSASRKSWLQRWKPSWRVRWRGGSYKVNFDLHRAGGLWTWGVLFVIAFTGFSMNLYRELFLPLLSRVSQVSLTPYEQREPASLPLVANRGFEEVLDKARAEAALRGWQEPASAVSYARELGFYSVSFSFPDTAWGASVGEQRQLYWDGRDGTLLGASPPGQGTVADLYVNAQLPLHSGRLFGLPGRILVSLTGVVVAMLSVTGVVVWWRKRRARLVALERETIAEPLSERGREAFSS